MRPEAHRELPLGADSPLLADIYNRGESGQETAGRAVLGCNSETTSRLDLVAQRKSWWRDSNYLAAGDTRLVELQVEESLKADIVPGVHIRHAGRGVRVHVPALLLDLIKVSILNLSRIESFYSIRRRSLFSSFLRCFLFSCCEAAMPAAPAARPAVARSRVRL